MTEKKIYSTKKFGDLIAVTGHFFLENQDKILKSGTPVLYKNKEGKLHIIPPKLIEKYIGKNESLHRTFLIKNNWETLLHDESMNHKMQYDENISNPEKDIQEKIQTFKDMDMLERQQYIINNIYKLKKQSEKSGGLKMDVLTDTVGVISDTIFLNKATLEDNLENPFKGLLTNFAVQNDHLSFIRYFNNNNILSADRDGLPWVEYQYTEDQSIGKTSTMTNFDNIWQFGYENCEQ